MTAAWSIEKIYFNSPIYFADLCKNIEAAKSTVKMEFYIFNLDSVGLGLLESLKIAASRGVRVRLVVDGIGSPEWTRKKILELRKQKVFVRIYHPPSRMLSLAAEFLTKLNFARFSLFLGRMNQRNHRKLCLIDGETAWIGSMNVTQAHALWRETAVEIAGPCVPIIGASFDWVWRRSRGFLSVSRGIKTYHAIRERTRFKLPKNIKSFSVVRLNLSPQLRRKNRARMLVDFLRTRKRLWLMNAYFVPLPSIIRALRIAVRRGVDVRLMVPQKSDVGFMTFAIEAFYPTLLKGGIRIFEYRPTMLHSKVILLDKKALVGSSNLNHRSLIHDYELDVELRKPESLLTIEKQFLLDAEQSNEITFETIRGFHWFKRMVGSFVLLMRYWI
jgi:cardiolipin synthase